jgi:uncharacterized membrane protein HdeD (DUF308 family)
MADDKSDEKSGKSDEKEEEKHGKSGKWSKDPLGGVFFGLVLITAGVLYIGKDYLPDPDLWWAWILVGIGIVSLLDAAVHAARPEWKRPIFGKVILGVVLIVFGAGFIFDVEMSWAVILIVIGVILLLDQLRKLS